MQNFVRRLMCFGSSVSLTVVFSVLIPSLLNSFATDARAANSLAVPGMLAAELFDDNLDLEIEFVSALRNRGLYRLSQLQCQQWLESSKLPAEARVRLTIEVSKTHVAHALNSRSPARDQAWASAASVLDNVLSKTTEQPAVVLLQMQKALTSLQQAEWTRREAEVQAQQEADWQPAREQIRAAIKQLKEVQASLQSPRMRNGLEGLNSARREELLRNSQFQLGRAYRNQAITYQQQRDRVNALTQAIAQLQPLATSSVMDDVAWQSRIDWIQCCRLLGDLNKTQELIGGAGNIPEALLGALAAEGIRLALAAKQATVAMRLIESQQANSKHPEFELAKIETFVALAKNESNAATAKQLQINASQIAAELSQLHGTYWGLRGEMLIANLASTGVGASDTSLVENAADTFLKRDMQDEAAAALDQGAKLAASSGNRQQQFDFRYKAATIDHEAGRLLAAIDRFEQAANEFPDHPQASEAHLLAVFDAAALYQQYARSNQVNAAKKSLARYERLLSEHLKQWPDSDSADQARLWAGRLAEARRDWEQAIELYQAIKSGSEHATIVYRRIGELIDKSLKHSDSTTNNARLFAARRWFRERALITHDTGDLVALTITSARLNILHAPRDYGVADQMLRRAITVVKGQPDQERRLRSLLVVTAAAGNNIPQARQELSLVSPLPAKSLAILLESLQPIRDDRPDDASLNALIIDIVKMLRTYTADLSTAEQLLIQQAVADVSNTEEATATYTKLAKLYPNSARIQLRYAELVSTGRDRKSRELALAQWRSIARKSKPQSPNWFRAKLGIAQTQFDMGEHSKAQQIIELLAALHPEMGGDKLKQAFMTLLQRSKNGQ